MDCIAPGCEPHQCKTCSNKFHSICVTAEHPDCDKLGVCSWCWYRESLQTVGAVSTVKSGVGAGSTSPSSSPAKSGASAASTVQSSPVKSRVSSGVSTSRGGIIGTSPFGNNDESVKAALLFNPPIGPSTNYSLKRLRETVDQVKEFVYKDLQDIQKDYKRKFQSQGRASETEKKIANLELKCIAIEKAIDKEKQTIVTLDPIVSENLEIISHLHTTVFKTLKSQDIPPQAYKAHNIAKKNLVYCYSSQLGAYKNKDSNLSKLIEAQRELIRLGRLPCPTCSDIVVEVTEDEDLLAEVQAIERAYAEKGRWSCDDEDHASASNEGNNLGATGTDAQVKTCQGCQDGCHLCEAGAAD